MGTRPGPVPRAAVLVAAFVALLAVGPGAAATTFVVVGTVKCLDCSPMDVDAEDALKGLKVAVKCKFGADGTYDTKALAPLDDTGAFSIPLAGEISRHNGELGRDCFAQLHTSPDTPCVGQAPPRIAPAGFSQDGNTTTTTTSATYLAAAADTVFAPVACACGKFKKKKHFMFGPPPPPPKPPTPTPTYGPPTPTPAPEPKPPAPPVQAPKPLFHKHPKMKKLMHKKKPCPPLLDDDTTRPAAGGQKKVPKKLN